MGKVLGLSALVLLLAGGLASSAPPKALKAPRTLKLSDTFALNWDPTRASVDVDFAPSFGVFLLQGKFGAKSGGEKFFGQVRAQKPPFVVTPSGVQRYWKQNLQSVSKLGEVSRDLGCQQVKAGLWQCSRLARGSAGNFVADRMIWNRNSDLIYVRVSSNESQDHARTALDGLTWEAKP